jgi:hypothetical protein
MKTKYSSNLQLSHVWANDPDPSIRKSANSMSCHNGKLYSYSTCIAHIIGDTVIYNTASFSVTTSKQQGYAYSATSHFQHKIYLDILERGLDSLQFDQYEFNNIIETLEDDASQWLIKASRARQNADNYRGKAFGIYSELSKYALFFNLEYTLPDLSGIEAQAIAAAKLQKIKDKEAKALRIIEQAEALEKWRAGEYVQNFFELTALRIKEDQIETTKGAKIPLDHAIKFWGLIKSWHDKGVSYVKDHHSINLGHYTVNKFDGQTLTVGCHSIPYSEIESIANQLRLN